jgi:O-antigen/teichoic acid export membrane protein
MGKNSATGSFKLFFGKVLSTIILAAGTIILGALIFEADYGLYTIALIPSVMILLFQDWGVGSAITKFCAHYRATNKVGELRRIIFAGLTFEATTGIALTVVSLLMANFIASTMFGRPNSEFLIALASINILSTGLFMASQAVFVGFERMGLSSLMMICQATAASIFSPLLVYLGYGATGAVIGYTLSTLATSVLSLLLLYFAVYRKLTSDSAEKTSLYQTLRPLLVYGIPLAIATILAGISPQVYYFIMASFADLASIGNFKIATNFAVLLTFFTFPIVTVLFPTFSKLDPQNEHQLLKTVFSSSVKYTALFLVPATFAMIVLSEPIIGTLYGTKWVQAPFFLALYIIPNLLSVLGNISMSSLLTAMGETKMLMKLNIITLSVGVPTAFLLIPQLGVTGLIIVTLVAGLPSMSIGLRFGWKRYGAKADFNSSARIFLASAVAAAAVYLAINAFNAAYWVMLATGAILFLATYLTVAPLIGAINQTDIDNLRSMFSSLGIISRILEIPLTIIQKILNARSTPNNQFSPTKENL